MEIFLKILAIVFALLFLGALVSGKIFFAALILSGVFAYYGWKPSQEVVEEKKNLIIEKENDEQEK